jgi:hypothetical protein
MGLTRVDKERISDSRLKLQAVTNSLKQLSPDGLRGVDEIQDCLEDAEKSLRGALRADALK